MTTTTTKIREKNNKIKRYRPTVVCARPDRIRHDAHWTTTCRCNLIRACITRRRRTEKKRVRLKPIGRENGRSPPVVYSARLEILLSFVLYPSYIPTRLWPTSETGYLLPKRIGGDLSRRSFFPTTSARDADERSLRVELISLSVFQSISVFPYGRVSRLPNSRAAKTGRVLLYLYSIFRRFFTAFGKTNVENIIIYRLRVSTYRLCNNIYFFDLQRKAKYIHVRIQYNRSLRLPKKYYEYYRGIIPQRLQKKKIFKK